MQRINHHLDGAKHEPTLDELALHCVSKLEFGKPFRVRLADKLVDFKCMVMPESADSPEDYVYSFCKKKTEQLLEDAKAIFDPALCEKYHISDVSFNDYFSFSEPTLSRWTGTGHRDEREIDFEPARAWGRLGLRLNAYKLAAVLGLDRVHVEQLFSKAFLVTAFSHDTEEEYAFDCFSAEYQRRQLAGNGWYFDAVLFILTKGTADKEDYLWYKEETAFLNYAENTFKKTTFAGNTSFEAARNVVTSLVAYYLNETQTDVGRVSPIYDTIIGDKLFGATANRGATLSHNPLDSFPQAIEFFSECFQLYIPDSSDFQKILGGKEKTAKANLDAKRKNDDAELVFDEIPIDSLKLRGLILLLTFFEYVNSNEFILPVASWNHILISESANKRRNIQYIEQSKFYSKANDRLKKAGLSPIYPRNPFELSLVIASISEQPEDALRNFVRRLNITKD